MSTVSGDTKASGEAGVTGIFDQDPQIVDPRDFAAGVLGLASGQPAVWGIASGGPGVLGLVQGAQSIGVQGKSETNPDDETSGTGVLGTGTFGVVGVGLSNSNGFLGGTDKQFRQLAGVYGESAQQGVMGLTTVPKGTGVFGGGTTATGGDHIGVRGETVTGVGVQGKSFGTGRAGHFIGPVQVAGDFGVTGSVSVGGNITLVSATSDIVLGDVAEGFGSQDAEFIEPGTVVVLNRHGLVYPSDEAYDKRVAGVVSGAGAYRPAIILDNQRSQTSRLPIALMGKVCCKVDAQYSPIEVGDLLTTSPTPGHAMKAADPLKAFGSVIGKALHGMDAGQGLIPILIALQ